MKRRDLITAAAVTPATIAWLLQQSMAQRARLTPIEQTCGTFLAWTQFARGEPNPDARVEQLLRVAYPEPTPVTVCCQLVPQNLPTTVNSSFRTKFFGAAPLAVVPAVYQDACGSLVVEWIVAGAQFSALLDLGSGALSIPAVDQVTISYAAPFIAPAYAASISVSAVPALMPGAVHTLTRCPVLVAPGVPESLGARQAFARRWKVTAAQELGFAAFGPLHVRLREVLAESAEAIEIPAGIGALASEQGWIETGGPVRDYEIRNFGATNVYAKLIEQIQVA